MRDRIAALIRALSPFDALEAAHIEDTLRWIATGAPLCRTEKPATPPRHLVAYTVLVDPIVWQLLLVDHRKAELWLPGGGHVEPWEDPHDTAEREVREELDSAAEFLLDTPLFLTVTETVGQTAGHTDVSLWYVLRGNCQQQYVYDQEEFRDIGWFSVHNLPHERMDPHLGRFAAKLLAHMHRGAQ